MSGKAAKKVRKTIRRGLEKQGIPAQIEAGVERKIAAEYQALVDRTLYYMRTQVGAAYRDSFEARMRPRPRRCPVWLWQRVVPMVIGPEVAVVMPEPPKPSKVPIAP